MSRHSFGFFSCQPEIPQATSSCCWSRQCVRGSLQESQEQSCHNQFSELAQQGLHQQEQVGGQGVGPVQSPLDHPLCGSEAGD